MSDKNVCVVGLGDLAAIVDLIAPFVVGMECENEGGGCSALISLATPPHLL